MSQAALRETAEVSKAWPFEEARKLIARVERTGQKSVLFETGYGPSGLPHIGTFGEVARTTMVRHAFRVLTDDEIETRLLAFSDDMDGLRKTPDNIPNRELIQANLGKPLTEVPDPFGEFDSFAAHNNARLRRFLDSFGFDYEFASSTAYYTSGRFDAALLHMLERFDAVQKIMLPSLREERAATYSPFLPIHPRTRVVMQAPLIGHDAEAGTIRWRDPATGEEFETPVTGGHCKLQWKPDWAMRWYALGVDYEMAGKDLIDSVKLSSQIVRALGGDAARRLQLRAVSRREGAEDLEVEGQRPDDRRMADLRQPGEPVAVHVPEAERGQAALFRRHPAHGRRLSRLSRGLPTPGMEGAARQPGLAHPFRRAARRRDARARDEGQTTVSFAMLLNLAAVANSDNPAVLWGFLRRYAPNASPENHPRLDKLVHYAVAYFRDFVAPKKRYRAADAVERGALEAVSAKLAALPPETTAEEIQHALYDIARPIPRYQDLKAKGATPERPGVSSEFFAMLYAVLLGEERGPRFGSFVALYGVEETRALIAKALAGELPPA